MTEWPLTFISQDDFVKHVTLTIDKYAGNSDSMDLKEFSRNKVDAIKLIFDKAFYKLRPDELIRNEILRKRDKSNTNAIGYFHQGIFQYIPNCVVPKSGWDVVYTNPNGIELSDGDVVHTVYVELKNKYNTMNSSSAKATYEKMDKQIRKDDDSVCCLVEIISSCSQNKPWVISGENPRRRIRRMSIDRFYALVTGQNDAFYQMCRVLPAVVSSVVNGGDIVIPHDTACFELRDKFGTSDADMDMGLYLLAFSDYIGFEFDADLFGML